MRANEPQRACECVRVRAYRVQCACERRTTAQHAAPQHSTQYAVRSTQHAARSTQHAARSTQHAARSAQQHSAAAHNAQQQRTAAAAHSSSSTRHSSSTPKHAAQQQHKQHALRAAHAIRSLVERVAPSIACRPTQTRASASATHRARGKTR